MSSAELVLGAARRRGARSPCPSWRKLRGLVRSRRAPAVWRGSNRPSSVSVASGMVAPAVEARVRPMDFDLSDDQLALRDGARELLDDLAAPPEVRAVVTPEPTGGAGTTPSSGPRWSSRAGSASRCPRPTAGSGSARSSSRCCSRRSAATSRRCRSPRRCSRSTRSSPAGDADAVDRLLDGRAVGVRRVEPRGRTRSPRPSAGGRLDAHRAGPTRCRTRRRRRSRSWWPRRRPTGPRCSRSTSTRVGRPPREPAMDLTRELGWLALRRARRRARLGGADAVDALLDRGATFAAAEMLGGAAGCSSWRSSTRRTGCSSVGPIGSFQAVKHRCADMLVDVEGMRSTVVLGRVVHRRRRSRRVGRGVDREDLVRGRVEAGDGVGAAGARRHRLHLGARPAPLPEAGPARPAHASATPRTTASASPPCCARGRRPATASSDPPLRDRRDSEIPQTRSCRRLRAQGGAVGLAGGEQRELVDAHDPLGRLEPGDALLREPGAARVEVERARRDDERADPLAEPVVGIADGDGLADRRGGPRARPRPRRRRCSRRRG